MITYIVYGTKHEANTPANWSADKRSQIFHTLEEAEAWKAKNDAERLAYIHRHHLPNFHYKPAIIAVRGTIGELVEKFPQAVIVLTNRAQTFKDLMNTQAEYTPAIGKHKGEIEPLN